MKTIDNINTWEECLPVLKHIEQERRRRKNESKVGVSSLLYRGQANSGWKLDTTLERYIDKDISLEDYYDNIRNIKDKIESYTQKNLELPPYREPDSVLIDVIPGYEYMIYLRHHNYPSPLLDWTASPYIAAFFAFRDIAKGIEKVSIYAYLEYAGHAKSGSGATIGGMGPNVKTHPRHYLQQCEYTICAKKIKGKYFYCNHKKVLDKNDKYQDLSWKINIPSRERLKVLAHLSSMNINAYSLFGSEESLMETLALEEYYLREKISNL